MPAVKWRIQMQELIKNCKEFGVELYDPNHPYQDRPRNGAGTGRDLAGDDHCLVATHIPPPTARLAHWPLVSALPKLNTYWQRKTLKQGRAKTMKIEVRGKAAPGITAKISCWQLLVKPAAQAVPGMWWNFAAKQSVI